MTEHRPDGDPPHFTKRSEWLWALLFAGVVTVGIAYVIFSNQQSDPEQAEALPPPGWEALEACGTMRSIDGTQEMELHADQSVVLRDMSPRKEGENETKKPEETRWEYDVESKQYAIALGGRTETYALLTMNSPSICILLKGDPGSANIGESWFATRKDAHDDEPRDSAIHPEIIDRARDNAFLPVM